MIFTLLFRAFKLCSNFELFHQEILNLKDIFKRNGYPGNFIDACIKRYLNQIFIDKKTYALAPKKELVCVLPFIGKKSLQLRSKLVQSVQNNLSFCHFKSLKLSKKTQQTNKPRDRSLCPSKYVLTTNFKEF